VTQIYVSEWPGLRDASKLRSLIVKRWVATTRLPSVSFVSLGMRCNQTRVKITTIQSAIRTDVVGDVSDLGT